MCGGVCGGECVWCVCLCVCVGISFTSLGTRTGLPAVNISALMRFLMRDEGLLKAIQLKGQCQKKLHVKGTVHGETACSALDNILERAWTTCDCVARKV